MHPKYFHSLSSKSNKTHYKWSIVVLIVNLVGCSTPTIYHWGNFEDGIYERYVKENHEQADIYLSETISSAETQSLRVPPGAYADYGFLLFRRGDQEGAKTYFEKEKFMFPESGALMTKLIERIETKDAITDQTEKKDVIATQTKSFITEAAADSIETNGATVTFIDGKVAFNNGDYAQALKIWESLANQGNADAQNNLGVMYAKGIGVTRDDQVALKWLLLAAAQGNELAKESLKRPEMIEAAKKNKSYTTTN